jgi:hypothetical protein
MQISGNGGNILLAIRNRFGSDSDNDSGKIRVEFVLGLKGKVDIAKHADGMPFW